MLKSSKDEVSSKTLNIVLLGLPGSGKGTIANKLVTDFKFVHISTGELIRQQMLDNTALANELKSLMESGSILPDNTVADILFRHIRTLPAGSNILFDGNPRTVPEASLLTSRVPVDCVIHLDVPEEEATRRLMNRWIHAPSGRTYSSDYKPPRREGFDDVTGEKLVKRADDSSAQSISKRMLEYYSKTLPVKEFFAAKGSSGPVMFTVSGNSSDVLYAEIERFLRERYRDYSSAFRN